MLLASSTIGADYLAGFIAASLGSSVPVLPAINLQSPTLASIQTVVRTIIKKGDSARALQDTLIIGDVPVDLSGTDLIRSIFRNGDEIVPATAAIVGSALDGTVTVVIPQLVYSVPGIWKQEWEVTYSNSTVLTVPSRGHNEIVVMDTLA